LFAVRLSGLFACALLLGCGSFDIKEKLGLNREGPDEYRVVPRPPLSVPPEFNLRPPGQSSDYVSGAPADARARDQVLGTGNSETQAGAGSGAFVNTAVMPVTASPLQNGSDLQFLSDIGASQLDPQIRQKLLDDKMNGTGTPKDSAYLFGGKDKSDPVVDPAKEAARIKQDQQTNQPVTTGNTPVIVPKDTGILGNIF
jgi:hypothetical protein